MRRSRFSSPSTLGRTGSSRRCSISSSRQTAPRCNARAHPARTARRTCRPLTPRALAQTRSPRPLAIPQPVLPADRLYVVVSQLVPGSATAHAPLAFASAAAPAADDAFAVPALRFGGVELPLQMPKLGDVYVMFSPGRDLGGFALHCAGVPTDAVGDLGSQIADAAMSARSAFDAQCKARGVEPYMPAHGRDAHTPAHGQPAHAAPSPSPPWRAYASPSTPGSTTSASTSTSASTPVPPRAAGWRSAARAAGGDLARVLGRERRAQTTPSSCADEQASLLPRRSTPSSAGSSRLTPGRAPVAPSAGRGGYRSMSRWAKQAQKYAGYAEVPPPDDPDAET